MYRTSDSNYGLEHNFLYLLSKKKQNIRSTKKKHDPLPSRDRRKEGVIADIRDESHRDRKQAPP